VCCFDDAGAIRISFGYMSTRADADAFLQFVVSYFVADKTVATTDLASSVTSSLAAPLSAAITALPVLDTLESKSFSLTSIIATTNIGSVISADADTKADANPNTGAGADIINADPFADSIVDSDSDVDNAIRVSALCVYPVKSCGAIHASEWPLGPRGLLFDREWSIVGALSERLFAIKMNGDCTTCFAAVNEQLIKLLHHVSTHLVFDRVSHICMADVFVFPDSNGVALSQKRYPHMCRIQPSIDFRARTLTLTLLGADALDSRTAAKPTVLEWSSASASLPLAATAAPLNIALDGDASDDKHDHDIHADGSLFLASSTASSLSPSSSTQTLSVCGVACLASFHSYGGVDGAVARWLTEALGVPCSLARIVAPASAVAAVESASASPFASSEATFRVTGTFCYICCTVCQQSSRGSLCRCISIVLLYI
jgi:hypothetical protein